jgi:amidophosphoribosyltransferase
MPTVKELIAHGRTHDEVCREIGADWLIYQDLEDLVAASMEGNPDIAQFDCSVFTGKYITGDVTQSYLDKLAAARSENRLKPAGTGDTLIGLHNGVAAN